MDSPMDQSRKQTESELLASRRGEFATPRSKVPVQIETTWDGNAIAEEEKVTLTLTASDISSDILLEIEAPFHDDPAPQGEPGKPFYKLWDYEVVEIFFLNEKDQYLEVEISPHGQHIVLLLNGEKIVVRHSLPLSVTSQIEGARWRGEALIPADYFPEQVSRFNAYAIHGMGAQRRHLSLYPTDGTTSEPNFLSRRAFCSKDRLGRPLLGNERYPLPNR